MPTTPTLFVFAGLPGSGKSTLAQRLARHASAAYVRIDTIEQALRDLCAVKVRGEGYGLAYRVAADNLLLGRDVVADSCNPIELTRGEWRAVARDAGARALDVEIVCSDASEHRRRVETRPATVPGLGMPNWADVVAREYEPWTTERIVIDTAGRAEEECVQELLAQIANR
jgi:predicted kinase